MKKTHINNIRLGLFVIGGLGFLVLLLYLIGKNQSMFSSTFLLKARFENVHGLVPGNNIRYAGIETGTVKKVNILNDTTIEVEMLIEEKMKPFIHKNAIVSIGTDGLIGNRVVNIFPVKNVAAPVDEGDILSVKKSADTDEMLNTLAKTNEDIRVIAESLKNTVQRINGSTALWKLLEDKSLPENIRATLKNTRLATGHADSVMISLQSLLNGVKEGNGSLGKLLKDTILSTHLDEAIGKIRNAGEEAAQLANHLDSLTLFVRSQLQNGNGTIPSLMHDSLMKFSLARSLENIRMGTEGFNQNMEALKHNFLFRGYFRKLEKQQQKEKRTETSNSKPVNQ